MKKQTIFAIILSLSLVASIFAHDLFLKTDSFFLAPNSKYTVKIMNGTFQASEGAVSYARLNDVSVVSAGKTAHPQESDFTKDETTAFFNLKTGAAGTYVVGLSTKHREIALKAAEFNEYLKEDGLPDTLEERRKTGELEIHRQNYERNISGERRRGFFRPPERRERSFSGKNRSSAGSRFYKK